MEMPTLEFLPNEAGEKEGLGDAGIETFRDDPYASCGRESGQNSKDATAAEPVKLTFDVIEIPASDFPAHDELRAAVDACWKDAKQEKEIDFFRQALGLLKKETVKVLRIADFSTLGLRGPPDQDLTPFHSLLKGSGVSSKESDTSGGSFGIGKNASFAVSDLQTVFYSTVYKEGDEPRFAAQGKVRLVSHVDAEARPRRATGYWGHQAGYGAITDRNLVPVWMRREDVGTSIFCVGFREHDHWADHITYALISNFFVAIQKGEMVFEVDDGRLKVNRNTLAGLFASRAIRAAAERSGRLQDFEFSQSLHRCLVSADATNFTLKVAGLGSMTLRILIEDGLPKRVGIVRNGMLITSSLEHFGDKLERFAGSRDFVAIVEPESRGASKLLKTLENPKHDSFSAQRLSDPGKRQLAETAMRQLRKDLRDRIRETTAAAAEDEVAIDELTQFFATKPIEEQPPRADAEEDPERFVYPLPKPTARRKQVQAPGKGTSGGRNQTHSAGGGQSPSRGPGVGSGQGGKGGAAKASPMRLEQLRNLIGKEGPAHRVLWFTPSGTGVASLRLDAPGINSPESLKVVSTSLGKVLSDGRLAIDVVEGERVKVELRLDAAYDGPIEAAAILAEGEPAQ
jgi:hypothetical protein